MYKECFLIFIGKLVPDPNFPNTVKSFPDMMDKKYVVTSDDTAKMKSVNTVNPKYKMSDPLALM